jgi:hypothetical protein
MLYTHIQDYTIVKSVLFHSVFYHIIIIIIIILM